MTKTDIFRRIAAFLTGLLLTVCAAAAGYMAVPRVQYDVRHDLSVYFTNSDAVIHDIRSAMVQRSPRITVTYSGQGDHMADVNLLVRDLMKYAFAETDSPEEGDYIYQQTGGYELQYSHVEEEGGYRYELVIIPDYYSTAKQERAVTAALQDVLEELHFSRDTSDYEKVRAIYEYIKTNVSYDKVHQKNSYYHLKSTAYGALINGTATCQGYAVLMYRLLREAGVPVRILQGYAGAEGVSQEYHAWNIVCIDGLYYDVDVTWDTQLETEQYFLRCDANFGGHTRDAAYADAAFYAAYPMAEEDYPIRREVP